MITFRHWSDLEIYRPIESSEEVYHKDIDGGRTPMRIVGARRNDVFLIPHSNDIIAKNTHKGEWFSIEGISLLNRSLSKDDAKALLKIVEDGGLQNLEDKVDLGKHNDSGEFTNFFFEHNDHGVMSYLSDIVNAKKAFVKYLEEQKEIGR